MSVGSRDPKSLLKLKLSKNKLEWVMRRIILIRLRLSRKQRSQLKSEKFRFQSLLAHLIFLELLTLGHENEMTSHGTKSLRRTGFGFKITGRIPMPIARASLNMTKNHLRVILSNKWSERTARLGSSSWDVYLITSTRLSM